MAREATEGARRCGEELIDDAVKRIGIKVIEEIGRQAEDAAIAAEPTDDGAEKQANSPEDKGYTRGDRRQLDRLFGDQEN